MLTTTANPPFHLFLSLTDPTERYDGTISTKLTVQDPPRRKEARLWNGNVGHHPHRKKVTDSPVSTAMEVNWIQAKRWTSALDANYSSAIHARAVVSD